MMEALQQHCFVISTKLALIRWNFSTEISDFVQMVKKDGILKEWNDNIANKLVTIQVDPIGNDRIVLLGDAAHSILPFCRQGMNAGFEDVQMLMDDLLNCQNFAQLPKSDISIFK